MFFKFSKYRFYFNSIMYEKLINCVVFTHRTTFDDRFIQDK